MFENVNGGADLCKFSYASGSSHKVSAQVAGETCAALESEGRLTAADLVDVSRPEDAPMHEEFEWDDTVAAEKYRENQAAAVIRHLVVKVTSEKDGDDEPKTYTIRAYSSTHETWGRRGVYVYTPKMLSDDEKRDLLLRNAASDAKAFASKYETLSELAGVIGAIDVFVEQYDRD